MARQRPPPPAAYPWLVYGNGFRDQSFHTISHPPSNQYYKDLHNISCVRSVPELCNKVVWNSCHGWLILSDDDNGDGQFSLFNPVTLECILLPPSNYNLDPQTTIDTCTLSSPPTDPSCMLFIFYRGLRRSRILICRIENKHWIEKRYDEEIEAIHERPISNKDSLHLPVFCNGKLYASTRTYSQIVSIDMVEQDPINLVLKPLGIGLPWNYEYPSTRLIPCLVESDGDIYFINLICGGRSSTDGFRVEIFKLDLTSVIWERMESVKDRVFFLCSKYAISCPTDQVGGTCVYFTLFRNKSLYAYNIEDDSVSVFLPCPYLCFPWKSPIWVMPDLRLTNDDRGKAVHIDGKKRAKPRRRRRRRRRQRKEVVEKGEDEKILEANEGLNLLDLPSDI
ncbi:hypothetical protein Vadar_019591 [Vaccinium darrowii]|uniref:Uncharacterized protein n=1 Tax=Vaccinium darrowii TaxID=229202 RepID=A0ACB7Z553_9ERIC|nr:hypothetical protein Vadar_019591 [Vaccinium darrowii]